MDKDISQPNQETDSPQGYSDLVEKARGINVELQTIIQEGKDISPEFALDVFRRGIKVRNDFGVLYGDMSGERLDQLYPNRRKELFLKIEVVDRMCAEHIPTEELTPSETEAYVNTLMARALAKDGVASGYWCRQDSVDHAYYVRSFSLGGKGEKPAAKLVDKVSRNTEARLTEAELGETLAYEDDIYKIHLNIRPEMRKAFLMRLFDEMKNTRDIRSNLRSERGDGVPIANNEVLAKGGITAGLGVFKFFGFRAVDPVDINGNRVPDFIFYLPHGVNAEEAVKTLREGMSLLARDFEDEGAEIPRFSAPVVPEDGYVHNALSEVQGDGDFKAYLQRIGRLDEFYDGSSNYSRRRR